MPRRVNIRKDSAPQGLNINKTSKIGALGSNRLILIQTVSAFSKIKSCIAPKWNCIKLLLLKRLGEGQYHLIVK